MKTKEERGVLHRPMTLENKQKLIQSRKGKSGIWKGLKFSEEHKNNIRKKLLINNAKSKKVINIVSNKYFNSITQAANEIGIDKSTLSKKLQGKLKNNTNIRYL